MRRKIANTIDESLYAQVKQLAQRDNKPINQVIEDSLREYLLRRRPRASVVQETRGTYNIPSNQLPTLAEEDLYGDIE